MTDIRDGQPRRTSVADIRAAHRGFSAPSPRTSLALGKLPSTSVTFGVYWFWRAYIDGYSALCVVYEVSLEVVMTTRA